MVVFRILGLQCETLEGLVQLGPKQWPFYTFQAPPFVSCIRLGVGRQDDVQMGLLGTSVVLHSK